MIEISTVFIFGAFACWYIWQQRREMHLAHVAWFVAGLRLHRTLLEFRGEEAQAEEVTKMADSLSFGCGALETRISVSPDSAKEVERAAMSATHNEWLEKVGLSSYMPNYLQTRAALFWLSNTMAKKK